MSANVAAPPTISAQPILEQSFFLWSNLESLKGIYVGRRVFSLDSNVVYFHISNFFIISFSK